MPKRQNAPSNEGPPPKKRKLNNETTEGDSTKKRVNKTEKKKMIRAKKELSRPYFKDILSAKLLWEKFRPHSLPKDEKNKLISEALQILKGNIVLLSNSSDVSRVAQAAFQLGTDQHRSMIFQEVEPHIVHMSQNQYSLHILQKILSCGKPEHKKAILNAFIGNVYTMLPKKGGVKVLDYYYTEVANAAERNMLLQELWGKEYTNFKTTAKPKTLNAVLEEQPEKRALILPKLRKLTNVFLQKGVIHYRIAQVIILEFLRYCTQNDATEVIEKLDDGVLQIMHTKEGSAIAIYCVAYSSPKHKKMLIKRVKQHLIPTLEDPKAHMFICALLAYTDDTVLLDQNILKGMRKHLLKIATNQYARRALGQVLCPKGTRYFAPKFVELLSLPKKSKQITIFKHGDKTYRTEMVSCTKKPEEVRTKELQDALKKDLIKLVRNQTQELITSDPGKDILVDIFKAIPDARNHCLDNIQKLLEDAETIDTLLSSRMASFGFKRLFLEKVKGFDFAKELAKRLKGKIASIALHQEGGAFLVFRMVSNRSSSKLAFAEVESILENLRKKAKKDKGCQVLLKAMTDTDIKALQQQEIVSEEEANDAPNQEIEATATSEEDSSEYDSEAESSDEHASNENDSESDNE